MKGGVLIYLLMLANLVILKVYMSNTQIHISEKLEFHSPKWKNILLVQCGLHNKP